MGKKRGNNNNSSGGDSSSGSHKHTFGFNRYPHQGTLSEGEDSVLLTSSISIRQRILEKSK
jgi:hypothetical protein